MIMARDLSSSLHFRKTMPVLAALFLLGSLLGSCGGGGGGGEAPPASSSSRVVGNIHAFAYANFHSRWDYELGYNHDPENPDAYYEVVDPVPGRNDLVAIQSYNYLSVPGEQLPRDLYKKDMSEGLIQVGFVSDYAGPNETRHFFDEDQPWLLDEFVQGQAYHNRDISVNPEPESPWFRRRTISWAYEDLPGYPDCIRASARYWDEEGVLYEITRWYAKNLGMVRQVRDSENNIFVSELISYRSGLDESLVSGEFFLARLGDSGGGGFASHGTATADGAGTGEYTESANSLLAVPVSRTYSYVSGSHGELVLEMDNGVLHRGATSVDGEVLAMADTDHDDGENSIAVAVRLGTGRGDHLLAGTYEAVVRQESGVSVRLANATVNVDGAGGFSLSETASTDGVKNTFSGAYSVDDAGRLTLDGQTGGAITSDGSLFVHVDADTTGGTAFILGVREFGPLADKSLWGNYSGVLLEAGRGAVHTDAYFDGKGGGSFQDLDSAAGAPEAGDCVYSVGPRGRIATDLSGAASSILLDGGLRGDSRIMVVGETITDSTNLALGVFVRRSTLPSP
ncbi:MAG: hypothetical protein ACLFOY_03310 [Desulfatibacillaceae bacterium]